MQKFIPPKIIPVEKQIGIKHWCQKVLPEIYDDSLSYYELLGKILVKIKEVINSVNDLTESKQEKLIAGKGITIGADGKTISADSETGDTVKSVNGKTGIVTITAGDVGARADNWMPTAQEVGARADDWMPTASEVGARADDWMPTAQEVGARADDWMPTAKDVGALPDTVTALPNPNKLTFTGRVSAEYDGSQSVTVNIPSGGEGGGAVDSVNGKTGAVILNAADVGARDATWMPTADDVGALPDSVTALPNPNKISFSGGATGEYDGSEPVHINIPEQDVKSVNGKTDVVILSAEDVEARPVTWTPTASEIGAVPASSIYATSIEGQTTTSTVAALATFVLPDNLMRDQCTVFVTGYSLGQVWVPYSFYPYGKGDTITIYGNTNGTPIVQSIKFDVLVVKKHW